MTSTRPAEGACKMNTLRYYAKRDLLKIARSTSDPRAADARLLLAGRIRALGI
jgi:hypothetical protein